MSSNNFVVEKVLSANDIGLTGSHQAGTLIPKEPDILGFFPRLNPAERNPRRVIFFTDDSGVRYRFCFIYYNSKLLGCGTRNEYRLTCMTEYMRSCDLKIGDSVVFSKKNGEYHVGYKRKTSESPCEDGVVIVVKGNWKVIHI